jgi:hypothetical protein
MERSTLKLAGAPLMFLALLLALAFQPTALNAQAAAQRFVGTISAISGDTLTIKSDAGDSRQIQIPAAAVLKRVAPGQKDLSTAETIQLTDLAAGDRVLVKLDPNANGSTPQALQIIAIKQTDLAQKQQQDLSDWQRNGVGGLVKSVDAASGVVMLTTGAGPTAKTVTVRIGKNTSLKRYTSSSIRFSDAQPASLDAVHPGDQFRAKGQKNADGTEIDATEVVSGSFRNISGTVSSIDSGTSTVTVKDLGTKKNVTIHITHDAEMRKLPDMMARMIAARLKGTGAAPQAGGPSGGTVAARHEGAPPRTGNENGQGAPGAGGPGGQWAGRRPGGDMEQVLGRAPAIQLSDLQKGEAVMLVTTDGTNDVTAIKLLAGVEPLLESPDASRNLLANWSMGGGGGGGGEEAQ